VVWLAAGVILASGLAVAVSVLLLRSQTLSDAQKRNEAMTHAIEEQTARTLQAVDLRLQIAAAKLARAAASAPLSAAAARALLAEQIHDMPFVRAMWVLDAQGRLVQDSDVGNLGASLGDRAYFRIHVESPQTGLHIGDPVISRTTGGWMLNMSRALRASDGHFAGVIVAALQPEWFDQLWASVGLGSGDAVTLVRRDGVLLMRSPFNASSMGRPMSDWVMFEPPMSGALAGIFERISPEDGVRRLYAFRNLSTRPELRVLVGLEIETLLEPWRRVAMVAAASWLATAGVIALLGFVLARGLARRFAAEQQMRSSTEKLNIALSGGKLGLWDWNVPSGQLTVNERWVTMLGLNPQGPPPMLSDWQARVHPEDRPKLDRLMQEVIFHPAGREFETEVRARHADGGEIWILDKGVVIDRAADGSPLRVAGTHLDITERKQAEQALLESQDFSASVINSLTKQIAVLDARGVIIAVNRAWRRFAINNGAPATPDTIGVGVDYLGAFAQAADDPQDDEIQRTRAGIRAVLDGQLPEFHLDYACHSATEKRWFQMNVVPMKGAAGGAVVSHINITERVLADAARRDSELRYRELFDSNPQPMWVFDVETLVFVAVNTAAVTQYGYSRDEFLGMTLRDIRSHEGVVDIGTHPASAPGHADTGRQTHRRKDGTLIEVEVASHGLDYGHRPCRLVLATDVTARERAEAEKARLNDELARHRDHLEDLVVSRTAELAAARQQAEAANLAKGAFLANMSHEIRTPLNAIVGLNYLIRQEPVTPAQAARLDKMGAAGQHLLSIISDVLDLSKIEAGRVQIESANFHLSSILDSVQSIVGDSARAKGLTVRVDTTDMPHWLRGDPTRLRQALLNFASNAVKFTEQGSISLNARLLHDDGDGLMVRFAVVDTGIGIPPEQLPRLFQAFEQADASITRKYGGTGLGLAISQRLAGLMGGECGAESEPGVGSTFWFTARLLRGHGVETSLHLDDNSDAETQLRQRHRGARILLAEDNEVNLEVALAMLHGVGLDVDIATDGREALRLAAAGLYDLVLMDMQMPEMGGLEATRSIRALAGWQTRPILALTANAFDDDRQACLAAGMSDFLAKPMAVSDLYAALLRWLDASVRRSDADARAAATIGS
jgi:PAS domain S-box-containing protein